MCTCLCKFLFIHIALKYNFLLLHCHNEEHPRAWKHKLFGISSQDRTEKKALYCDNASKTFPSNFVVRSFLSKDHLSKQT